MGWLLLTSSLTAIKTSDRGRRSGSFDQARVSRSVPPSPLSLIWHFTIAMPSQMSYILDAETILVDFE